MTPPPEPTERPSSTGPSAQPEVTHPTLEEGPAAARTIMPDSATSAPVRPRSLSSFGAGLRAYARTFSGFSANARRLLLAATCLWVGIGSFGVLFNLYLVAAGYNVAFIGLLAAIATVGQALASPLLSRLLRLFPARTIILVFTALTAVTMVLSALFTLAFLLILVTLAQGLAVSAASIPSSPFIVEQSTVARRAHLFSAYTAATNLGSMLGSLIGGAVPVLGSVLPLLHGHTLAQDRLGLIVGAVSCGLGVWALWGMNAEQVEEEETQRRPNALNDTPLDEDQMRGNVLAMMAASASIAIALGAIYPLLNVYFSTVHHASTATIGILYAVSGICCTIGSLAAPLAARNSSLSGLVSLRLFSAPLMMVFWLNPSMAFVSLAYIGRNILGTITGALENTFTMEVVPATMRGTVASWRTFSFNVGWTAGSLAAGVVVSHFGFDPIFVAGAVFTILGSMIWYHRFGSQRWLTRFPIHVLSTADEAHDS